MTTSQSHGDFARWYEGTYAHTDEHSNALRKACMAAWQAGIDYDALRRNQAQHASTGITTLGELPNQNATKVREILQALPGLTPERIEHIQRLVRAEEILSGEFQTIYMSEFGQWYYRECPFDLYWDRFDVLAGWRGAALWLHRALAEGWLDPDSSTWGDTFNRRWEAGFDEWYVEYTSRKHQTHKGVVSRRNEGCYVGWKGLLAHEMTKQGVPNA